MNPPATALAAAVDALVAVPLGGQSVEELQVGIVAVAPHSARLEGWLQAACGQLALLTRGSVPTPEGGKRTVAVWVAEARRGTAAAAGAQLRTSELLRRGLPAVVDAVLDGALTPEQARVLSRLVGKISDEALRESQPQLIEVAAGRDPAELASWVAHQIATHCEPVLDADADSARRTRYLQTATSTTAPSAAASCCRPRTPKGC